jgi:hypothetical protein
MKKKTTITAKLGRKKVAPVNVAAKALREGQFKARIEKNPKAYTRKGKHKAAAVVPDPADEPKGED